METITEADLVAKKDAVDAAREAMRSAADELEARKATPDGETDEQRAARHAEITELDAKMTPLLAAVTTAEADYDQARAAHQQQEEARVAREREIETVLARTSAELPGFHVLRGDPTDDLNSIDARNAPIGDVRDVAMRAIERADRQLFGAMDDKYERAAALERIVNRGRVEYDGIVQVDADPIARGLVITERPAYRSAFLKGLNKREAEWTPEERAAITEYRALNIGTPSAGGYAIPVVIDPTVIITDGISLNPLINLARVEPIITDKWKGVSGGQTVWAMVAEAEESTDNSSTFDQPVVEAKQARAFIPYSYEISMDWPGFATEMGRLLGDGYTTLVANQLAVGDATGNNTQGVFTGATQTVEVATFNTFVGGDIDNVYAQTPELFRARGNWVMNVDIENRIRAFSEGSEGSRFTVNQTAAGIGILNGKQVALTDHAPTFASPQASQDILVYGDFQHFVLAQRIGMNLELIPNLVGATNRYPTGQRGLVGWARFGSGVVATNAFRKLVNKAS